MHEAIARLRSAVVQRSRQAVMPSEGVASARSWDLMRATYEEQAKRGMPEAIRGLERIEQGRWPTNGRPRQG